MSWAKGLLGGAYSIVETPTRLRGRRHQSESCEKQGLRGHTEKPKVVPWTQAVVPRVTVFSRVVAGVPSAAQPLGSLGNLELTVMLVSYPLHMLPAGQPGHPFVWLLVFMQEKFTVQPWIFLQ